MNWFHMIGWSSLFVGICCIPFLFATRQVSKGMLPSWSFWTLAVLAVLYFAGGVGVINREWWCFYPLVSAIVLTGGVFLMGAHIHFRIANMRGMIP